MTGVSCRGEAPLWREGTARGCHWPPTGGQGPPTATIHTVGGSKQWAGSTCSRHSSCQRQGGSGNCSQKLAVALALANLRLACAPLGPLLHIAYVRVVDPLKNYFSFHSSGQDLGVQNPNPFPPLFTMSKSPQSQKYNLIVHLDMRLTAE